MTPPARLQAAIELFTLIEREERPADATAQAFFRDRRFIGAKDRQAVGALVWAWIRHRARLGWWLGRFGHPPRPRALALAHAVLGERQEAAALAGLFGGARFGPHPLDPGEKRLLQALDAERQHGQGLDHPDMPAATAREVPDWAAPGLQATHGPAWIDEAAAQLGGAPLDLRVNQLKAERAAIARRLEQEGFKVSLTPWSPWGLRLPERTPITGHPLFKDGTLEIQDEGSQLVALATHARPGDDVLDFCAGAGGKTLAVAAAMGNKGRVLATDILPGRLERARLRLRRGGVHNAQVHPIEHERDPWLRRHRHRFDRVLVDAPCSGTGTWRRNPDLRWRQLGPALPELKAIQARLLDAAARLVKPGGRLIYATCSLLAEENGAQIDRFLAAHPGFRRVPARQVWSETGQEGPAPTLDEGDLVLTPARHATDGFFAAILERDLRDTASTTDDDPTQDGPTQDGPA